MTEHSALATLVGGYFHQDIFELYADEFAAVDDFVSSDPSDAASLPGEIEDLLANVHDETGLEDTLDGLGCDIEPDPGVTYREWLTQIANHVRTAVS